jgi:hypothetical protein
MSKMSDYLENKLIDHLFRTTTFTAPAGVYVALGTAAADNSFTEIASTGGYARVSCGKADASWNATQGGTAGASSGTGGGTANAGTVTFPSPSATWNSSADITHFALYDASSGGNMLFWGTLTVAKRVYAGDAAPTFPAGSLTVTLA